MKSRREFLSHIIAVGGVTALPVPAAFAQIVADAAGRSELRVLSSVQARGLTQLADIILPATDTPAASDTGVVMFIDGMLADWYENEERHQFLQALDLYASGTDTPLSITDVAQMDSETFSNNSPATPQTRFYRMAKELVLVGYFTSREGMMQSLHNHGPVGDHSFKPSGPPGDPIKY